MRCPSCQKFVSLEMQEPEVNDIGVEYSGLEAEHTYAINGTVRIVRACANCGDEMKEATFDLEATAEIAKDELGDINPEECEVEASLSALEEGGGRYAKSYFGAEGTLTVTIGSGDKTKTIEVPWSDKVAASSMDELG